MPERDATRAASGFVNFQICVTSALGERSVKPKSLSGKVTMKPHWIGRGQSVPPKCPEL